MKGDFTRSTFRQFRHFRGVRMQQGRVQLDADWNEQLDIEEHLSRTETRDVIGLCGAPIHAGGFKVLGVVTHSTGPDLVISPGRIYVDGLLCEIEASPVELTSAPSGADVEVDSLLVDGRLLEAGQWVRLREGALDSLAEIQVVVGKTLTLTVDAAAAGFTASATLQRVTTYRTQPHLPDPDQIDPDNENYVAYLEVWQRHLTEVQEPDLREPALGGPDSGPDTTTRAQTVWQLRLEAIDPANADPDCDDFAGGWLPSGAGHSAELRARATPSPEVDDECLVPPEAGYRGLEHQLYRVEIHADSDAPTATFKWSRDNGSVVYPITGVKSVAPLGSVTVASLGRDAYLTIKEQDVVEVVDDTSTLLGVANDLYRVQVDPADLTVSLDDQLPGLLGQDQDAHPLIRRWDHRPRTGITIAADGAVEIQEDQWLPLESGVEVMFRAGSTYRTGDYWLIPARAGVPEGVLWPQENTTDEGAVYQGTHGIERDYCVVGLVVNGDPEDCRPTFPPLTELELLGCCRRIEVGDDIQEAIDKAIADGGGCLCLARGLHVWAGELRIHGGRNVTVHGEPGATLLLTSDEAGAGGISIKGSHRIGLGSMFVTGWDIPWLVRILAGGTLGASKWIDLSGLRMFNPTPGTTEAPWTGAVLAAGVSHLGVSGCTIAAHTGLLSLAAVTIPGLTHDTQDRTLKIDGVSELTMRDTHIRYFDSGITAFSARSWMIEDSRFDAMDAVAPNLGSPATHGIAAADVGATFEKAFELAISSPADSAAGRCALESILWIDSTIRGCRLDGVCAMIAIVWARGSMEGSTLRATKRGLEVGWLQKVLIGENRIHVAGGPGIAFAGAFRSDIDENTIRARQGIVNVPVGRTLTNLTSAISGLAVAGLDLGDQVGNANAAEIVVWWLLLEEITDLLGLRGLVDAIDGSLATKNSNFTILLLLAAILQNALEDRDDFGDGPEMPIVDLTIDGNDINARLGISLQEFLPLGGLRVQDNRVLAEREQAIVVNSGPYGRNPRLLGAVLRTVVYFAQTRLPTSLQQVVDAINDPELRETFAVIVKELLPLIDRASTGLLRMLETDYRIEGNTVRTPAVVIETNLYEALIGGNHVTQEQSFGFEAIGDVLKKLREFEVTEPVARAVMSGEPVYAEPWAYRAIEALPAEAAVDISRCLPPPAPPDPADEPEIHRIPPRMRPFRGQPAAVPRSFGGPAVWAKSPGVSISENLVIVPPDSLVESWGWGGILVKGDEPVPELFVLLIIAAALKIELSSMMLMSETLVADNEVAGGFGHGVRVAEIYVPLPPTDNRAAMALVSEIRIAANQVRNMGGAGIVIDEGANAVGVDISGNMVRDCSFNFQIAQLQVIDTVGGIVGRNCAFVKVHGNRVSATGNAENMLLYGIDFERVFQLSISDNTVVHSGASITNLRGKSLDLALAQGGIKADLILGAVAAADNDVTVVGSGAGILVKGLIDLKDWVISPILVLNVILYLEASGGGANATGSNGKVAAPALGARAKVTDNQVTGSTGQTGIGLAAVQLADLVLTGNSVRNLGPPRLLLVASVIGEGVVGNNLADQVSLGPIGAGTITGNRSSLPANTGTGGAIKANNS